MPRRFCFLLLLLAVPLGLPAAESTLLPLDLLPLRQAALDALDPTDTSPAADQVRLDYASLLATVLERDYPSALAVLEPVYARALAADPPPEPKFFAVVEDTLATARFGAGQDPATRVFPLLQSAIARAEAAFGPEDAATLNRRANLSALYYKTGRYDLAVPLFRDLYRIRRRIDPNGSLTEVAQNHLSLALAKLGRWDEAEALLREVIDQRIQKYGPDHREVAVSLNSLCLIYFRTGRAAEAIPLMERIVAIRTAAYGAEADPTLTARHNLASLLQRVKRFDEAEKLVREDLARTLARPAAAWHEAAEYQRKLGEIVLQRGDPAAALPALSAAAATYLAPPPDGAWRSTLNEDLYGTLQSLALAQFAAGETGAADATVNRWLDGLEAQFRVHLGYTNEADRIALVASRRPFDLAATIATAPTLARAVVRLKGLTLESLVEDAALAAAATAPTTAALLAHYRQALAQPTSGPELDELERTLTREIGGIALPRTALTLDPAAVLAALPPQAALIEWVRYAETDLTTLAPGPEHYAALLGTTTAGWQRIPLGPAAELDELVERYQILTTASGPLSWAQELRARVLDPVRAALPADITTLCVVPDSALHRVNFATLPEADGTTFTIERHRYVWLNSARDLLPAAPVAAIATGPVRILAAPTLGGRFAALPALPGARREIDAARRAWPDATVLTGAAATAGTALAAPAPRVLHFAAHGLWALDAADHRSALQHSGIALAPTDPDDPTDDGFLSAAQIAATDLRATELVVISACGSGGGPVRDGEGVLGLRRALARAGVRTALLALWSLDDDSSATLIDAFYSALAQGAGPTDAYATALRSALPRLAAREGASTALRRAGALMMVGAP